MPDVKLTVQEVIAKLENCNHEEMHLHHTYKPDYDDFTGDNHQRLIEGMRNYHKNVKGWLDYAYHITIFPDGTIYSGREFTLDPASIKSHNHKAFAVVMVGNFDFGNDKPTPEMFDSVFAIAKYFKNKGRYIRFHNENSGKTCPGSSIDKAWFMSQVDKFNEERLFKDLPATHWAYDDIKLVTEKGFMSGYTDGTFGVGQPLKREEFASVIARIIKELGGII